MADEPITESKHVAEDGTITEFTDQDGNPCPPDRAATAYIIRPDDTRLTIDLTKHRAKGASDAE